jgi:hypothetical protein
MKSCATEISTTEIDRLLQVRCERALEDALTNRGNPLQDVDGVLSENSGFIFAHCLRAALIVRADDPAARSKLIASITAIEVCSDAGDLARRHASAAHAWLYGDPVLAVERYGAILNDHPRDILALVAAHALDFRLGQRDILRDRVAKVLPEWEASLPYYASVLAMYAFGLEETGQYRRAEEVARRALALNARHPGAIHVIAHVLEMQGRDEKDSNFSKRTNRHGWTRQASPCIWPGIAPCFTWMPTIQHPPSQSMMRRLSDQARPRCHSIADASALLWRLQLRNIRLNERWQSLADRWEMQKLDGARPFYVAHAMMALAAAGRTASAQSILDGLPIVELSSVSRSYPEGALVLPLCKALLAFTMGDYTGCVELLGRVRHLAHQCGGSLAQCDLLHLTLTEAALRARKANLARALVTERAAKKPASPLNRRLLWRLA